MATARKTRVGVLILGGGFAGCCLARLLDSGPTVVPAPRRPSSL